MLKENVIKIFFFLRKEIAFFMNCETKEPLWLIMCCSQLRKCYKTGENAVFFSFPGR